MRISWDPLIQSLTGTQLLTHPRTVGALIGSEMNETKARWEGTAQFALRGCKCMEQSPPARQVHGQSMVRCEIVC